MRKRYLWGGSPGYLPGDGDPLCPLQDSGSQHFTGRQEASSLKHLTKYCWSSLRIFSFYIVLITLAIFPNTQFLDFQCLGQRRPVRLSRPRHCLG